MAAELLGEALDQPAAEPGIGASRIDPLAVVGDRQAELPRHPLQRHQDSALCVARKSIFDGIRHELVHHEPDRDCPVGRQELAFDVGLEHDERAAFLVYRCDQVAA